jgi:hypothetical protein
MVPLAARKRERLRDSMKKRFNILGDREAFIPSSSIEPATDGDGSTLLFCGRRLV